MCFILLLLRKSLSSCAVNCAPLSQTNSSGRPCVANTVGKALMVASSCTGHAQHMQQFGLSIDDHQERSTLEWTAVVHMHPLPRAVWPNPRVVRSNWCFTTRGLTHSSSLTVQCQCPVMATKHVTALMLSSAQFRVVKCSSANTDS